MGITLFKKFPNSGSKKYVVVHALGDSLGVMFSLRIRESYGGLCVQLYCADGEITVKRKEAGLRPHTWSDSDRL